MAKPVSLLYMVRARFAPRAAPPGTASSLLEPGEKTIDQDFRPALTSLLPDLRAFARFLSRDPAAADDLVQDTLLRALRNEAQWQAGTSLRAWTFSILRNCFLESRRRAAARQRALDRVPVEEGMPAGQEHRMEVMGIARAMAHLPREQQEALVLVGALGFSSEDAARVAGVQIGTLKARVSRARRALSARYEAGEPMAAARQEG